jgi:N-acyl-D-amino-acid deacylase
MDAHGGWIASTLDLARFAAALDSPGHGSLLKRASLDLMYQPPPAPVSRKPDGALEKSWYGCGWAVRPAQHGKANYWHTGSLPGTATLLVRRWDGLSWAVLFNQRSEDKQLPDEAIDSALHRAADSVTSWPTVDLFSRTGSG